MSDFSRALIIYNPNSTGNSELLAKKFCAELGKLKPGCKVDLMPTTHAGHAEELGYQLTRKCDGQLLLVSVSGDGGYNELINGVMKAVDEGAKTPICAILPGGNANDHHTYITKRPLHEAVAAGGLTKLDILRVEAEKTRYAHSYVGLGLTPLVAVELNKHKLSVIREMWLSLKTFMKFKPFRVLIDGKRKTLDSLIMANVGVMAKHLKLNPDAGPPQDGKFEILHWSHNHKLRLVQQLLESAIGKIDAPKSVTSFAFTTLATMPMQLDGELVMLRSNQKVTVTCAAGRLRTYR